MFLKCFTLKTFAKMLQNICKTFLQMFYFTCNHGPLQAVFDPAKMFCNIFANVF